MKLELRDIKRNEGLSHETHAYTGSLYWEHVKVATVENAGRGGPDQVNWIKPEAEEKIKEYLSRFPKVDLGFGLGEVDVDLELWCQSAVSDKLTESDYKALLRKCVAIYDVEKQEIFEVIDPGSKKPLKPDALKGKKGEPGAKAVRETIEREHPNSKILNDLPFDEGVKLYNPEYGLSKVVPPEPERPADGFEATEDELAQQTTRHVPGDEDEISPEQQTKIEEVRATLEKPVPGETEDEQKARIARNQEKMAAVDPKIKRLLEHLNRLAEERKKRSEDNSSGWYDHPGSKLKNPPDAKDIVGDGLKPAASKPGSQPAKPAAKSKEAAPGSLRDRLKKAGIKPVNHKQRRVVADMVCRPEGASTNELASGAGCTPHDVGNHIFYLKHENGYVIETKKDGKVNKYYGRPPTQEEIEASKPKQAQPQPQPDESQAA
jgi:hypothetical protein